MYSRRKAMACAFMATIGLVLLTSGYAGVTSCYWEGPEGSYANWSSANWSPAEPGAGDLAYLGRTGHTTNALVTITSTGEVCYNVFVGYSGGTSGTIDMSSGALSANYETVGTQGTGAFTQTGGVNQIDYSLTLGQQAGATGSYELSGTGVLSADREYMGNEGSGSFTQTGGTNTVDFLHIGRYSGSSGTYELNGGTLTVNDRIQHDDSTDSTLIVDGGVLAGDWTSLSVCDLKIGYAAGTTGTFTMDAARTVSADEVRIGGAGTGGFTQTGGNAAVANTLWIADQATASGCSYTLSGGTLTVGTGASPYEDTIVGRYGQASFTHTGGTHTAARVILGDYGSGEGTYDLSGAGQVNADNEYVGWIGTGAFTQDGGTNTVDFLNIGAASGSTGTYELNGGTLTVNNNISHHSSANSSALIVDGGALAGDWTSLSVCDLKIGYAAGATGTFTMDAARTVSADDVRIGEAGTGGFTQTGGTHTISNALYLGHEQGAVGTYSLSGGALSAFVEYIGMSGTGVLTQQAGTNTTELVCVGYEGTGTYTLEGGVNEVNTGVYLGMEPGAEGTYRLEGGALSGPGYMIVRDDSGALGELQGYGLVSLTGNLTNNGRVVADGMGADRRLDLSSMGWVGNMMENTSTNGWFAVDHGRLELPAISISGAGPYNWGESSSDTTIDLVNSVRMDFTNPGGGDLSISLLAADHGDVPLGLIDPVGIWYFDTAITFDEVDLTFRYDDALAATLGLNEAYLQVMHYVGGNWEYVTTGIDTANHWIYADDVTSFSYFAVVGAQETIPEPISLIFFGTGVVGVFGFVARRKMRRL